MAGEDWRVTHSDADAVFRQVRSAAVRSVHEAGKLFQEEAVTRCPVSDRNDPGYIHLYETIGYDVEDEDGTVTLHVYADKPYAGFVNNGTSRMAPRPFFSDALEILQSEYPELVARTAIGLQNGVFDQYGGFQGSGEGEYDAGEIGVILEHRNGTGQGTDEGDY